MIDMAGEVAAGYLILILLFITLVLYIIALILIYSDKIVVWYNDNCTMGLNPKK